VTSSNVEGTLRAMTAEGFAAASFEDQRPNRLKARCFVVGAMTPSLMSNKFKQWEDSGFNRRFLWPLLQLEDPTVLERAAVHWARINFRLKHVPLPPFDGSAIPNLTTARERHRLLVLTKHQPGGDHSIQVQILTRTLAVLRWWYQQTGDRRSPMDTLEAFGVSLGKNGTVLTLEEPAVVNTRQEQQQVNGSAGATLARQRWNKARRAGRQKPKPKRKGR
jgi:hypothetical protein